MNTDRLAKYVERPSDLEWHDVTENEEKVSEDTDSESTSADEYERGLDLVNAYNIDDRRPQRVSRKSERSCRSAKRPRYKSFDSA